MDASIGALVLAAREAMTNAAKFAGVDEIDVYAEVTEDEVSVFVRDRGAGFDRAAVPGDRRGLILVSIGCGHAINRPETWRPYHFLRVFAGEGCIVWRIWGEA